MGRRRSGYVQIDVNEILEEVDDDDLLDEVSQRKLITGNSGITYGEDLVREAHDELLCGRPALALSILERLIFPKWKSVDACTKAFTAASTPER